MSTKRKVNAKSKGKYLINKLRYHCEKDKHLFYEKTKHLP